MDQPGSLAVEPLADQTRPRHNWPLIFAAIGALSFYLHSLCWWTEPVDVRVFLRPWLDHIVHYGPIGAFAHPFSNYTPAYLYLLAAGSFLHTSLEAMYIVKLLSVAGTIFAAYALAQLVKACGGEARWAALLFILPSAVLNAALLAQCDAIWAGACVLAVAAMIRGRPVASLVWCGIAIAFKAQAAFAAPFIIGALIGRRAPLWQWALPALVFATVMAPAWLAGWPAAHLAMIYPSQPGWVPFPSRLANPWMFATVFAPEQAAEYYWAGFAGAALAAAAVAALTSSSVRNPRAMLLLALLSSLALPFFFPKMLERYYFLADLLSLGLAIAYRTRGTIFIAVAVQLASFLSLLTYLYFYFEPYPTLVGAVFAGAALVACYVQARRCGARWPAFSGDACAPLPASAERTAA